MKKILFMFVSQLLHLQMLFAPQDIENERWVMLTHTPNPDFAVADKKCPSDEIVLDIVGYDLHVTYDHETKTMNIEDLHQFLLIKMHGEKTIASLLDKTYIASCKNAFDFIGGKIRELLQDTDNDEYVNVHRVNEYVDIPKIVEKQPFWGEAETLLKQIDDNESIQIRIPYYQYDALINLDKSA